CLIWYLYLDRKIQDHCVAVSWDFFGFDDDSEPECPDEPDNVFYCAPSFEAFVYRSWIESSICTAVHDERSLSEEERAYAEHCRKHCRS
ncbi:MAG: hypothetical protein KDA84_14815, partial [Planctomycetaceae bacterium]|nr:hypothetical protein [Planctomycetaceae bacterium]